MDVSRIGCLDLVRNLSLRNREIVTATIKRAHYLPPRCIALTTRLSVGCNSVSNAGAAAITLTRPLISNDIIWPTISLREPHSHGLRWAICNNRYEEPFVNGHSLFREAVAGQIAFAPCKNMILRLSRFLHRRFAIGPLIRESPLRERKCRLRQ
jgi:hypothetical protein